MFIINNKKGAKAKLAAWAASLQNQEARLFKLEEAKRHQARIDMQVYISQYNVKVHFDTFIKSPVDEGPGIKETMERVNLSLQEIENSNSIIWTLIDWDTIYADLLVDDFFKKIRKHKREREREREREIYKKSILEVKKA